MHNLKQHFTNFDWSLKSILKVAVALVVVVIAFAIVLSVIATVARGVFGYDGFSDRSRSVTQEFLGGLGFEGTVANSKASFGGVGGGLAIADFAAEERAMIAPVPPFSGGGDDAEEFERRDYGAHYETRKFEQTCGAISGLKPREDVVFDNANEGERWCSYNFRVELESEEEIVELLKGLNPRDFDTNVSTIERSVEYTESELELQERRLASLQETLTQAENSFDSLIARATREGDTATLSEVINNKIATVERLTQQILNSQERIDRLTRNQDEQTDQIEYAHFNVSVQKQVFFDGEGMADEWKRQVQDLAREVNATVLALTVGLLSFILSAIQFIVFAAISILGLVVFGKVIWVVGRKIWKVKLPK